MTDQKLKEAREAAEEHYRKIPLEYVENMSFHGWYVNGFTKGAQWQAEQMKELIEALQNSTAQTNTALAMLNDFRAKIGLDPLEFTNETPRQTLKKYRGEE